MENDSSPSRTQAKSAIRALDLLEVLAADGPDSTFTGLVETLKIPKSSLFQLLAVLSERGYVVMDPLTRRYRLGIRAWELGQAYGQHRELVAEALPVMREIVALLNETVQLSVLDGRENVYLAKVDCSHALRLQSSVGRRLPAHATGLGKVLLAYLPADDLARQLDNRQLLPFTRNTITDQTALRRVLAGTRARGVAIDNEEYTVGVRCVAVPIYGSGGVVAAISTSIPSIRATPEQLAAGLRLLVNGSLDISRSLGCTPEEVTLSSLLPVGEQDLIRLLTDAQMESERAAQISLASQLAPEAEAAGL